MDDAVTPAQLDRLLEAAARDPAERPAFTAALLASEVFVLGYAEPTFHIAELTDDDGSVTPFFTSPRLVHATLLANPSLDHRYMAISCRRLFEQTAGRRLVLNPHGSFGKVFLPGEIEALLAGEEPGLTVEALTEDTQVLIGAAAHVPDELPHVLARFLVQRPVVQAAHLGWIAHADGAAGFLMVVVASDPDKAMAGFGTVSIGDVTEGVTLEVIVVPPDAPDHLLSAIPPFYVRQPQADVPTG